MRMCYLYPPIGEEHKQKWKEGVERRDVKDVNSTVSVSLNKVVQIFYYYYSLAFTEHISLWKTSHFLFFFFFFPFHFYYTHSQVWLKALSRKGLNPVTQKHGGRQQSFGGLHDGWLLVQQSEEGLWVTFLKHEEIRWKLSGLLLFWL